MPITTAKGTISHSVSFTVSQANSALRNSGSSQNFQAQLAFTGAGPGANQFNQQYTAQLIIPAGVGKTATLDFINGTITGNVSATLANLLNEQITGAGAFARIKEVSVWLQSAGQAGVGATASSVTVGPGTANPWVGPFGSATDKQTVLNGGRWANGSTSATGWTVTAGHQTLTITNQDASNPAYVVVNILGATS